MRSSSLKLISTPPWRAVLRKNFNRLDALADFLELTQEQRAKLNALPRFALQVPFRLAQKMAKGTLDDPLLRQFVPLIQELESQEAFTADPVCDAAFRKSSKLLHKYEGRVLLACTSACAMHCRYCFRQNFDYSSSHGFEEELTIIENDASIHEVILSGGDPLSLSDETLGALLDRLAPLPHIKRIRFHTRYPIGIPERIDLSFLKMIGSIPQQLFFVIHCNHSSELDEDVLKALHAVKQTGAILLNQAVLLKGVNDDEATLCELAERLVDNGILFYYLHQLDRIAGGGHFEVDESNGRALIAAISEKLPGYAIPKYVKEIPGEASKTTL